MGYVSAIVSSSLPMKTSLLPRLLLAAFALGVALMSSGCGTTQRSASAPIPPNWYDSYYYRDGHLVVPNLPQSPPAVGVWDQ